MKKRQNQAIENRGGADYLGTAQKNRSVEYDFIKGFVMLLITWGHVTNALFSGEVVYYFPAKLITATFAMPIYMYISGYFLRSSLDKHSPRNHVVSRVKRVLVPCLIWNVLTWSIVSLLQAVIGKGRIGNLNIFGIWFLWALLICDLLMTAIVNTFRQRQLIIIITTIIAVLLLLIPFELWHLAWVFPFYAIGYFSNSLKDNVAKKKAGYIWMIAVAVYVLIIPFYQEKHLVYYSGSYLFGINGFAVQLEIDLFRFIIGALGTIVFLGLGKMLCKFGSNRIIELISNIGRNSLQIYVIQILLVERVMTMTIRNIHPIKNLFQNNYDLTCYLVAPVITIAVVACCIFLSNFAKRNRKVNLLLFGG